MLCTSFLAELVFVGISLLLKANLFRNSCKVDIREFLSILDKEDLIYDYEEGRLSNKSGEGVGAKDLAHCEPQIEELAEAFISDD